MKILLTGGAGYIGSACLRWLLKHGHDPIAFDNMYEGNALAVPEGRLVVGKGPVRTGVSVVHPRGRASNDPVFGAWFTLNGNGEMTGTTWLQESGILEGPIAITNTNSVGVVRDAILQWQVSRPGKFPSMVPAGVYSSVIHYLKAVAALKSDSDGRAVVAKMKEMPTDDPLFGKGSIRVDGRKLHDAYLFEVKSPKESKYPGDDYKLRATIPAAEAFRPLKDGGCPLVGG